MPQPIRHERAENQRVDTENLRGSRHGASFLLDSARIEAILMFARAPEVARFAPTWRHGHGHGSCTLQCVRPRVAVPPSLKSDAPVRVGTVFSATTVNMHLGPGPLSRVSARARFTRARDVFRVRLRTHTRFVLSAESCPRQTCLSITWCLTLPTGGPTPSPRSSTARSIRRPWPCGRRRSASARGPFGTGAGLRAVARKARSTVHAFFGPSFSLGTTDGIRSTCWTSQTSGR